MTTVALTPLVLKDVILTIGVDSYQKAVNQCTFTPSASTIEFAGLGLNSVTDTSTATWTLAMSYMQDWDTTTSLSRYLYDNEGETVAATFSPRNGSGPTFTTDLVITPGAIGGDVNAFALTSVTLGCSGKPTLVESAAAPTVVSVTPSAVAATGVITITGVKFTGTTGAAGVKVGATNVTSYVVLNDATIVAVMPAGSAGATTVTVTNATGASNALAYTRGA
jgi:hypothetical protein